MKAIICTLFSTVAFFAHAQGLLTPQNSVIQPNRGLTGPQRNVTGSRFQIDSIEGIGGGALDAKEWQKKIADLISSGSWTGSGGDGVACFADANVASQAVDKNGQISRKNKRLIKELYVLDYYEFSNRLTYRVVPRRFMQRRTLKRFGRFLNRKTIRPLSPLLSMQLRYQRNEIPVSSWKRLPQLPAINDSGRIRRKLPSHCRLVQIAVRLSPTSANAKMAPMVFIDRDLFRLLRKLNTPEVAILNQSMLMLHEKIYLMASKLGHYDSSKVRRLVALLFSTRIQNLLRNNSKATSYATFVKILDRLDLEQLHYLASIRNQGDMKKRLVKDLTEAYLRKIRRLRVFLSKNKIRPRQLKKDPSIIVEDFVAEVLPKISSGEAFLISTMVFPSYGHMERFLFKRNRLDREDHCELLNHQQTHNRDHQKLIKLAQKYCSTI